MPVDNHQIITIPITKKMIDFVNKRVRSGVLNSRTLVDGEGNRSGLFGEVIVANYLGYDNVLVPETKEEEKNYDLMYHNVKIDVKTKGNCIKPKSDFDCSIPLYQNFQKCDVYIFTRISKDETSGWIKGWIKKEDFWKYAKKKASKYNNAGRDTVGEHMEVLVSFLEPIETLKEYCKEQSIKLIAS